LLPPSQLVLFLQALLFIDVSTTRKLFKPQYRECLMTGEAKDRNVDFGCHPLLPQQQLSCVSTIFSGIKIHAATTTTPLPLHSRRHRHRRLQGNSPTTAISDQQTLLPGMGDSGGRPTTITTMATRSALAAAAAVPKTRGGFSSAKRV
jgi:hypothetical protein